MTQTPYFTGGIAFGILGSDDDSAGSGNSRIQFIAPAAGTYCLHATSYGYGAVGPYTLVTSVW